VIFIICLLTIIHPKINWFQIKDEEGITTISKSKEVEENIVKKSKPKKQKKEKEETVKKGSNKKTKKK
jgi:hypothetical protein